MTNLRRFVAENVYGKIFHSPHWKVGWRRVSGPDLWDTQSLAGTRWNVLQNPRGRFLADPIAIERDDRTILFVEDFDHRRQKGVISALEFNEQSAVGFFPRALEEPWHLSYPFVMEWEGEVWMIPESAANREAALYRADPFPTKWKKEATLLRDVPALDTTIVHHDDRFWLLTTVERSAHASFDLYLFSAPTILGPWRPHQNNPVLRDARSARSAGKIIERGGRLWRPVQDCSRRYGAAVGLAEITCLNDCKYEQQVRSTIAPCREWPGRRLHTLSQAGGFEFIDGSANTPRWAGRTREKFHDDSLSKQFTPSFDRRW
jgi:hypothetical protein